MASPVAALNVPAKQAVGVRPLGPEYPSFATQAVAAAERVAPPVAELYGQSAHTVWLAAAAYVPEEQSLHDKEPALELNVPASHWEHAVAWSPEYEPASQLSHNFDSFLPVNLPASQFSHGGLP